MQLDKIFSTQFLDATTGAPLTGLSATITIMEVSETDGTTVATPINNVACIEGGNGFYRYYFSEMSPDKVYEGFINPNSSSAVITSIWVDKRQNYLDKPLSQIIGTFFTNRSTQYDFGMEDRSNLKKLVEIVEKIEKADLAQKISDTSLAIGEVSRKIDDIEMPEMPEIPETDLSPITNLSDYLQNKTEEEKKAIISEYETKISELQDTINGMEAMFEEFKGMSEEEKKKLLESKENELKEITDFADEAIEYFKEQKDQAKTQGEDEIKSKLKSIL